MLRTFFPDVVRRDRKRGAQPPFKLGGVTIPLLMAEVMAYADASTKNDRSRRLPRHQLADKRVEFCAVRSERAKCTLEHLFRQPRREPVLSNEGVVGRMRTREGGFGKRATFCDINSACRAYVWTAIGSHTHVRGNSRELLASWRVDHSRCGVFTTSENGLHHYFRADDEHHLRRLDVRAAEVCIFHGETERSVRSAQRREQHHREQRCSSGVAHRTQCESRSARDKSRLDK